MHQTPEALHDEPGSGHEHERERDLRDRQDVPDSRVAGDGAPGALLQRIVRVDPQRLDERRGGEDQRRDDGHDDGESHDRPVEPDIVDARHLRQHALQQAEDHQPANNPAPRPSAASTHASVRTC